MGSKTFDGVRFSVFRNDHPPTHVHGFYGEEAVIIELMDGVNILSSREKSIVPRNAKKSDVNHILRTATKYAEELVELWRLARA